MSQKTCFDVFRMGIHILLYANLSAQENTAVVIFILKLPQLFLLGRERSFSYEKETFIPGIEYYYDTLIIHPPCFF